MLSLFHFEHLKCTTNIETKSFTISLDHPYLTAPMLLELEDALGRLSLHGEINTILLKGKDHLFSQGIDPCDLKEWSLSDLNSFNASLKKITMAMPLLPQNIVVDLGTEAKGHALELALGADIRVARKNAHIEFNFLTTGFCPSAGGLGYLQQLVGHSVAKFWILSSRKLSPQDILHSNFVHEVYGDNRESCLDRLLVTLNRTAPVCRAQAKRGFFESFMETFKIAQAREGEFARGAHFCEDWKKPMRPFTTLEAMKKILRRKQHETDGIISTQ